MLTEHKCDKNRRSLERIAGSKDARFFYGNMFYSGTILNFSGKGIFIHTTICLPADSQFRVMIRNGSELLTVMAKVKWTRKSIGCGGMGTVIQYPSQDYVEFVHRHKLTHKT